MSDNMKKYKVSILGEAYHIVSDEPEERVFAVAQQVDSCMKEIYSASSIQDVKRVAVLAALQFASKHATDVGSLQQYDQKTQELIAMVENVLPTL